MIILDLPAGILRTSSFPALTNARDRPDNRVTSPLPDIFIFSWYVLSEVNVMA